MTRMVKIFTNIFSIIFLSFIVLSCSGEKNELLGKWDNDRVIIGGKIQERPEFTKKWIEFFNNGTYVVGNYMHDKTQTGKWNYNTMNSSLSLDSDAGPYDDSSWKVNFRDNKMIWTTGPGPGTPYIEIIMKKSAEK